MEQRRIDRIKQVVAHRQSGLIVVFEDLHDPHNVAAILRTCDALGVQTAYLIFEKEKPYNPKRIGKASSSSANKWLNFQTFQSTVDCLRTLKKEGYTIIATALTANAQSLSSTTFSEKKIALLVGNEHAGLSQTAIDMSDKVIMIPMLGFVQSLNVSVATALMLWEITRQRAAQHTLDTKEQKILFEDFLKRAKK